MSDTLLAHPLLHMGGYGMYVWPCYALAVAVLAGLSCGAYARLRKTERQLAAALKQRAETQ